MDSLNRTLNGRPIVVCELVGHANGAYLINNISVRPEWPIAPTFGSENSRVRRIIQQGVNFANKVYTGKEGLPKLTRIELYEQDRLRIIVEE